MIQPASFMIDGYELETMGFLRSLADTVGHQTVVAPYALMLQGLCFRVDEQWAPAFVPPVNTWTLSFAVPTTTWSGITLPSTTWIPG